MAATRRSASSGSLPTGKRLPSGVLAFLLTDIEGSTQRWEAWPDAMRDALDRHDTILRESILSRNGHVFRTAGDSFFAAFATPSDAVAAALHAQQALTAQDFSAVGGLKVRMAVHAGPVSARNRDYFGPGINRTARLLRVAYGGQVLISGTVAHLLQAKLPSEAGLFDLGEHRFRDLAEPEHVYQLLAPGLAGAFPPLRSLGASADHLPRQLTSLIGRENDVAEIKERLKKYRLLTITGSGGVGKTRVAVQVGSELLDEYPDGVWFVELGPLDDPRLVAEEICSTVGLSVEGNRSAVESAVEFFRAKRVLLILDNCEHLVSAVAHVTEAIIRDCPQVTVLATSRESLAIAGESTFRIPSLSFPQSTQVTRDEALSYSAVRLFVERASAVAGGFELSDSNVGAVVNICGQLDGIPLAIELAVPRLTILRAKGLADGLRDRFRLLGPGSRTALPRHRTLQTLFDWSYNLLDEREQALLRRLSVFVGGWTVESAIAVVSGSPVEEQDIFELISSLADKSLVIADLSCDPPRYKLLETTRQYAFQKLAETSERGRRRRLAEFMVRFYAESMLSWPKTPTTDWLRRHEPEVGNLRASLEWAFGAEGDTRLGIELTSHSLRIWDELSLIPERQRWFSLAVNNIDETVPPATAARLWLGYTSVSEHGVRSAFQVAERAASLFRAAGDDLGLAEALTKAGASVLTPMETEVASRYLQEALELFRPSSPTKQLASCLRSNAVAAYFRGDFASARHLVAESTATAKAVGDTHGVVNAQIATAELEFAAGNIEKAIAENQRMIDEGMHNPRQLTLGLGNMTSYLLAAGRLTEAKVTAFSGLHRARAIGWQAAIVRIVEHLALISALSSDMAKAARLLGFTEAFYAKETASREITEYATYNSLKDILERNIAGERRAELMLEGSRFSDVQAMELGLTV